jgi:hypothetical protein
MGLRRASHFIGFEAQQLQLLEGIITKPAKMEHPLTTDSAFRSACRSASSAVALRDLLTRRELQPCDISIRQFDEQSIADANTRLEYKTNTRIDSWLAHQSMQVTEEVSDYVGLVATMNGSLCYIP